jgi:hypothetical protein
MPLIRSGARLIHFAHVPKCGGSAIEAYLKARFGAVAMLDDRHHFQPVEQRWSRTSPQHMSLETHKRLFPEGFIDHSFAAVRHPVDRIVSVFHFQREIEKKPAAQISFSAWLDILSEMMQDDPFIFDNHARPMSEMVPEGAKIFHLEHGLDAMVPWFDELTQTTDGPRAVRPANERKSRGGQPKVTPGPEDLKVIGKIYAADFERFGYVPEEKAPLRPAPKLSPDFIAERDTELACATRPRNWLRDKLNRVMR